MNRFVASRREEDTGTGSLFDEGELPASQVPPKPVKEKRVATSPTPAAPSQREAPGSRKSVQDYEYEDSLEGVRKKYDATSQGIPGFDDTIYLPNGEAVSGVWKLVDAFSVSPSHDPFTFHNTKGFPKAEGGGSANTRDYANEASAKEHVIAVAGDFDGRALGFDSAVVVTKDGVVISGNNRTMSSQLAARKGTDVKYVDALMKRCRSFGFTQDQVAAFEHPRVVFEIDSQDYSPEHFEKYNDDDKKEQDEEARIVKYSKLIKPDVLREIADVYARYQFNFGNVYANPQAVQEILNYLVKGGVIPKTAVPGMFNGIKLGKKGREFIEEYTLGAVLKEHVVRALYSEGMGDLKVKVADAAPLLLQNWAMGSYAVVDELNKAIEYAVAYVGDLNSGTFSVPKLEKEQAKAMTAEQKLGYNLGYFAHWADQGDLYEVKDPVVLKLAGALVYSGPLFKEYLEKLNAATASAAKSEREAEEAGNEGLFGDTSPDRHGLLEKAVASWNRRYAAKRDILSSVVLGGGDMAGSELIVSDVKSTVMKWTSAKPENRQAWQQAVSLFRENFGHGPKSERDAKLLLKTAKKMAVSGEVFSGEQFKQFAKEEMTGQGGEQGYQDFREGQSAGSVPGNNPVELFKAIKALYKSGQVTKEQLEMAFQKVVASVQRPVVSILRGTDRYTAGEGGGGMSPTLQSKWEQVKAFIVRLRSNGVRARDSIIGSLQQAFRSWMTPQLAEEAYQQFSVFAGVSRDSAQRFRPLTSAQRKLIQSSVRVTVGSQVVYNPVPLGDGAPAFLVSEQKRLSGQVGKIASIDSELYNVEMPDGEVVSALESELSLVGDGQVPTDSSLILSARPVSNDPMRETVREFLSNVSSLTKVPSGQLGIQKEVLERDHVVYMHTETLPNGKPYTVEFHVVPGEPAADVYVVRDFDNHPLEENGFTIEDMDDWNLSEVDRIDGLFAEEMARTGVKKEEEVDTSPSVDETGQYTFDKWWSDMGNVSAGLRRPSLVGMAICSGVYAALSPGERVTASGERERGYAANIPSGVQAFLNRTLDFADKLVRKPLTVVDEVGDTLMRGVSGEKAASG